MEREELIFVNSKLTGRPIGHRGQLRNAGKLPTTAGGEMIKRTLDEYRELCTKNSCKWCGCGLPSTVLHYPHPGGWSVIGFDEPQWLYLHCVRCDYDHALWKLGVPR